MSYVEEAVVREFPSLCVLIVDDRIKRNVAGHDVVLAQMLKGPEDRKRKERQVVFH